jgi:hypothetical protein
VDIEVSESVVSECTTGACDRCGLDVMQRESTMLGGAIVGDGVTAKVMMLVVVGDKVSVK